MNREEYFEEFRKTSSVVKDELESYLAVFDNKYSGVYNDVLYLASTRITKDILFLKPFLVRLSYEACGGRDWIKISPICAAAEFMNISSYQANLSFDGKYGIDSKTQRNNQFIASMITRELVSDIIYDVAEEGIINNEQAQKITQSFALSNKNIYIGQYEDLNILVKNSLCKISDFENFLKLYIHRCDHFSGVFSERCAMVGGILANSNESLLANMGVFGRNFGIGLHIVNDIGDFIPESNITVNSLKKEHDQYNDLRHGKLTLPIMYALTFADDSQKDILKRLIGNMNISNEDKLKVTKILWNTGAISYSKRIAKSYWRKARLSLHNLPWSKQRELMSIMISQVRSNKYFFNLRRLYSGQKNKCF